MTVTHPRPLPPLLSLRVFEAVARHLSFTAAAHELHVTQSAVSHHIRKLEDDLGRSLFERRTRSVQLTEAGHAYYDRVHTAFDLLRTGTEAARAPRTASGTLTVALLASFAMRWLALRLSAFQTDYPEIDLRLQADVAAVDLEGGAADVAIRYGRGQWPGLDAQKLMPERLTLLCAPALIDGTTGPAPAIAADLLRFPLLQSHSTKPFEWTAWSARFGLDLRAARTIHLHDYNIVVEAALAGQGIAMGRHRLIAPLLANGSLVAALPDATLDDPHIGWWLVTPRRPRSEAAAAFSAWLTATAQQALAQDTH